MSEVWRHIQETLSSGESALLMVVTKSQGSAPGKVGFKMSVAPDGMIRGTIGGGVMEHSLAATGLDRLQKGEFWNEVFPRIHHRKAPPGEQSGMICAGSQELAVYTLGPDYLEMVKAVIDAENGKFAGSLVLEKDRIAFQRNGLGESSGAALYQELVGRNDRVHIIGGGHVGLALSKTLELLDFDVHVYDHRPDVATMQAVTCPKTITSYEALEELIPAGPHEFVVIVSTGWTTDAESLFRVIGRQMAYIGLMGSRAKIGMIFKSLKERGVSDEQLARVKAPIGIPIRNHTPAEIGVSIAAQLIDERNRLRES